MQHTTFNLPPRAPRYRSILRLQRFIQNPIPFMNENLQKYGDTYCFSLRYSKINILTINPDLIQHILRKNVANYEKPIIHTDVLGEFIGKGLLLATGEQHTTQRKLMAPGFRPKSLGSLVDLLHTEIDNYLDEMDQQLPDNKIVDIYQEFRKMTFRVMAKAIYSSCMDDQEIKQFHHNFTELQDFFTNLVRVPSLIRYYNFTGKTKTYKKIAAKNNNKLIQIAADRRTKSPKDDLLGMLMEAKYDDGSQMTNKQLQEESLILFIAGHETASDILAWIFYLLDKHPATIQKIKAEKERVVGAKKASFTDLFQMEYLSQVINECLRLYPPSWITDRIAKEADEILGWNIPKGARVIPFIYGLHHSDKLWSDPEVFNPERFTKENRKDRHNFAHMPFGAGPRQCIGRHFAMMEMQLIVLKMLERYTIRIDPTQKIDVLPLVTLRPKYGMRLILEKN